MLGTLKVTGSRDSRNGVNTDFCCLNTSLMMSSSSDTLLISSNSRLLALFSTFSAYYPSQLRLLNFCIGKSHNFLDDLFVQVQHVDSGVVVDATTEPFQEHDNDGFGCDHRPKFLIVIDFISLNDEAGFGHHKQSAAFIDVVVNEVRDPAPVVVRGCRFIPEILHS